MTNLLLELGLLGLFMTVITLEYFEKKLKKQGVKGIRDFWVELKKNNYDDATISKLIFLLPDLQTYFQTFQIKNIAIQSDGISVLEYISENKESLFSLPKNILINTLNTINDLRNIGKNTGHINARIKDIYYIAIQTDVVTVLTKLVQDEKKSERITFHDKSGIITISNHPNAFFTTRQEEEPDKMALSYILN